MALHRLVSPPRLGKAAVFCRFEQTVASLHRRIVGRSPHARSVVATDTPGGIGPRWPEQGMGKHMTKPRCHRVGRFPPYAAAVRALLENGPMQGKTVEVEAVEGRPPKTIDVPDEKGGTCRYCLAQWTQEGMTAAYTFLYAV